MGCANGGGMKICYLENIAGFEIRLTQSAAGKFTVTYGKQVFPGLSYGDAAKQLGQVIMHALACESKLDNGH